MVAGVARGLAEHYQVSVFVVRLLWVAAMLAAPVAVLVYALFAISMPSEEAVLSELELAGQDMAPAGRARFERLTGVLGRRLARGKVQHSIPRPIVASLLLFFGAALALPRLQGSDFFFSHPIIGGVFHINARIGSAILYLIAGIALPLLRKTSLQEVALRIRTGVESLHLERGPLRSIGGLASAVARMIGVDVTYVRSFFVLLNVLTFGVFGVCYLGVVFLLRRTGRITPQTIRRTQADDATPVETADRRPASRIQWAIGLLFLGLAMTRIMTEFRLFFFNEPFFQGILFAAIGFLLVWDGLRHAHAEMSILLLAGSALVFVGVEDISSAVFRVQLPMAGRFEVAFLIAGLSIVYYCIVRLTGSARRVGLVLALVCFIAAVFVQGEVLPSRYLIALAQFYDFFYPLIFVAFGLNLALD